MSLTEKLEKTIEFNKIEESLLIYMQKNNFRKQDIFVIFELLNHFCELNKPSFEKGIDEKTT